MKLDWTKNKVKKLKIVDGVISAFVAEVGLFIQDFDRTKGIVERSSVNNPRIRDSDLLDSCPFKDIINHGIPVAASIR